MSNLSLQLTADGSYTICRDDRKETYHSRFGAVTEATEVFLTNSGVKKRLEQHLTTRVLEIGFGSGLNFLLSAQYARHHGGRLLYTGYDIGLPPAALISELLLHNTQGCNDEVSNLIDVISTAGTAKVAQINSATDLTLSLMDARSVDFPEAEYDAIYLDAFSLSEDPVFWQTPFLKKMHRTLKTCGALATYSVNRPFKNALSNAGFTMKKLPGPKGKREVIVATRCGTTPI